ncbi:hypothetical protein [Microbacterium sp. Se63.02b]|uniref:hypothetical protein n=1 Tax=Microbacterium sp. Se63.02b TaxID=2709304 RepID=UPI0016050D01|nr:hypothetical protein [Microbacterium sp. Se63.02b]QNA92304.1 hypothetical protein G4G29_07765 [Microbacterium sp. Se63.02b]
MTSTVERPETRTSRRLPAGGPRPGTGIRWRVAARLARRQLRRTLLSSALIGVLVMLPIAAMTAYAVIGASMVGTAQERVTAELGQTEAWISVAGAPGSGFWQSPTDPTWFGYPENTSTAPEVTPIADPTALLPSGTEAIRVVETDVRVETPDGVTRIPAWGGEVWDERFHGRFELVDGTTPRTGREIMATPATLERLGVAIGGEVVLTDSDRTYTVVGTLDSAVLSDATSALFLPASAGLEGDARWYLPDLTLSWSDVEKLNEDGVVAYARSVILDPPDIADDSRRGWSGADDGALWTMLIVLIAGGLFAAYVVVMLAGAAFAVAARRQQRSSPSPRASVRQLPTSAASSCSREPRSDSSRGHRTRPRRRRRLHHDGGARRRHGDAVLGLSRPLADPGRNPRVLGARRHHLCGFPGADGGALRHSQRPPRRTSPAVAPCVETHLGIDPAAGRRRSHDRQRFRCPGDRRHRSPVGLPLRTIPPFGIVIGPVLVQIGILLSGRWLLWVTAKALSRLSLAARIAARDAAANSSRTVPAFAAIAATVFIAVFAIGQTSMQNAWTARDWMYQAPVGTLAISIHETGTGAPLDDPAAAEAEKAGIELADAVGASGIAVVSHQPEIWSYASAGDVPADATRVIAVMPERHLLDPVEQDSFSGGQNRANPIAVIAADEVEDALGITMTSAQRAAYRSGAAIVTDPDYVTDGTIDVGAWTGREAYEGEMPDNIWTRWEEGPPRSEPIWEKKVDAIELDLPHQGIAVAIAPETATELDMEIRPFLVIASFDGPVPVEVRDRVQEQADASTADAWVLAPYFEDGPPDDSLWMIPILAAVGVLVLGASGVALSLARFERRPDDATLSAVGGTDSLRRRIGFWQGLIIAGFGTIAGAAAGVLPPIGFAIQSRDVLLISDIPWLVLALLAVALPLAIATVSWLVPPRKAELTRRTAIA